MIAREKDSVQISNGDSAEGAIVLKRTGGVDALPVLDEHAGPESRESIESKSLPVVRKFGRPPRRVCFTPFKLWVN